MFEPDSADSPIMEGNLWKRPRGQKRSVGAKAKFEERFFRLTDDKLEYWKNIERKVSLKFLIIKEHNKSFANEYNSRKDLSKWRK